MPPLDVSRSHTLVLQVTDCLNIIEVAGPTEILHIGVIASCTKNKEGAKQLYQYIQF